MQSRPRMGYQPGLDGLRAISVVAVIFYHGGFSWMHGGFFGVEVFFVISGFLITTLLIEERDQTGRVGLSQFWIRRARRLFPALLLMLVTLAAWVAFFGTDEQTSQLRRDLPWSIFYLNNWSQIVGDVPYFQPGDPPLLRHLWSLAVEEQWYVVWPLVFCLLAPRLRPDRIAKLLVAVVVAVGALSWWVHRGVPAPLDGPFGFLDGADRVNFNYLSTITRAGGLLLGAAAAFVWRPWRAERAYTAPSRGLDVATGVGLGLLVCCFIAADLTAGYMYPWLLTFVSLLSLLLVMVVVHPAAAGSRWVLSFGPLVAAGRRSYGWYLWHWPVFVIVGATEGSWPRFVVALALALGIAELSYRYVEEPVRRGAIEAWWRRRGAFPTAPLGAAAVALFLLGGFYWQVDDFDVAAGGEEVAFDLAAATSPDAGSVAITTPGATAPPGSAPAAGDPPGSVAAAPPTASAPPTTRVLAPLELPRDVSIVGDSQAHSLAINLPSGIEETFTIEDHSLDGCSVYDAGRVRSQLSSFDNNFAICEGWQDAWGDAGVDADVVLVVLGAWDVFDLELDGTTYPFGSPEYDQLFATNLNAGLDRATAGGAHAGLLEVACMRPVAAEGAGVPPLPERGDDARVAHLNGLLRTIADGRDDTTFVPGPTEWCADEAVATDLGHRWDGVHVYKPGANLIYETIAPTLLELGR